MPRCKTWGEQRTKKCTTKEDQGYSECSSWADEGHNDCRSWKRNCCTWWPCSWACDIVSLICTVTVWVANVVCKVAVWVSKWVCVVWAVATTAICLLWDLGSAAVNAIGVSLEGIFGWVLSLIAVIVAVITSIPIIGTYIRWVIGLATFIAWTIVSIFDAVVGLLGIRPEKRLRVCAVVLSDERGNLLIKKSDVARVVDQLQVAATILKRDANIRLMPSEPFKYATGFAGAPIVTADWVKFRDRPSIPEILDPPCSLDFFVGDFGIAGSEFNLLLQECCFFGAWRRLIGYGAPVTIFYVRSTPVADGCSTWIVDFVAVAASGIDPTATSAGTAERARRISGHELGHACNLLHLNAATNPTNLMGAPRNQTVISTVEDYQLEDWQVLLIRASKHVTYF